jgi:hypothetical protein
MRAGRAGLLRNTDCDPVKSQMAHLLGKEYCSSGTLRIRPPIKSSSAMAPSMLALLEERILGPDNTAPGNPAQGFFCLSKHMNVSLALGVKPVAVCV